MARISRYDDHAIFDYLVAHKATHDGLLPSGVALKQRFHIKSNALLQNILQRMERNGLINGHTLSDLHIIGGHWYVDTDNLVVRAALAKPLAQPAASPTRPRRTGRSRKAKGAA